ncbi:metalloendopeptidase [Coemansia sp. RSA 552]|nr:metalloendopeptidase [Coemansia sp. RSA 552]
MYILNHAVNEATRKKIFVAHGQMHADNIPILQEIVGLRKQQAGLLGYKSYSHYVLESQMAKTPQAVKELETQLHGKLAQAAAQEHGKLVDMKRNNTEAAGRAPTRVYDWDYPYYANMVTKKKHGVDHSIIKQYFVCEATVEGILDVFRDMLGLEIVSVSLPHVWHPDVQAYEVWETDGHVHVGCFFLDLFSRPGKYDHPAVWTIRPGYEHVDKTRAHPISALVAGFPKAESTTPTLLKHQHVKILLHEFGHLFHGICSSTKWSRFHGTTGPVDFVEAPSQMMEYWAWEPCFLRRVARHYKTKEPLPEQLLKDLVASRNDEIGIDKISQVFLGMYDLRIHSKDIEDIDVSKLYNSMHRELAFSDIGDAEVYPVAASMQMANGYAGLYYGYLWSEMISADMFATRFLADGIDNKETGMEYRNEILRPGDSRDPAISLEKFIGRKPNATAFLEMIS